MSLRIFGYIFLLKPKSPEEFFLNTKQLCHGVLLSDVTYDENSKFKLIYFQKEARYRGQKFRKDVFLGNPCFNEGKTSVGLQDLNLLTSRENQELAKFVKYQQTCAEIERVFSLQSQKIRQWTLKQLPNCIVTQTASGYN